MSNSVDPDETAHRLIWIYALCKNLLLSPVAVKELILLFFFIILLVTFSSVLSVCVLTLLMLNTTCPVLANSVDPDQLASEEAN